MTAITVQGLSKRYTLGARRHNTLRDQIASLFRPAARDAVPEPYWAVRDVSFDVQPGEVVGIIGRNGAGKSTLLKMLSQITEPTEGEIRMRGRTASLLEVGTGFHPELSGRENIYLNGAILGMTRQEIAATFDAIVAFAEMESFLDTPVKHYSSGMYMRLAFAVAAHLQPEILIVDEVLAVGDAAFQAKCLGKMSDVARGGRTILFVSHNMAAIAHLCTRALLIVKGRLEADGTPSEVIPRYLSETRGQDCCWSVDEAKLAAQRGSVRFSRVEMLSLDGSPLTSFTTGEGLRVRLSYEVLDGATIPSAAFVLRLKSGWSTELLRLGTTPISGFPIDALRGSGSVDLIVPVLPFAAGRYFVDLAIARAGQAWYVDLVDLVTLEIEQRDVYGSGLAIDSTRGSCVVPHRWVLRRAESTVAEDSGWIGRGLLAMPDVAP